MDYATELVSIQEQLERFQADEAELTQRKLEFLTHLILRAEYPADVKEAVGKMLIEVGVPA